jgi:peroxiredoxin
MKHLFLTIICLVVCMNTLISAPEVKTLEIGQKAPDFRLPCIDGKLYSLDDFKEARLLVIVFTACHCPTAQAYEDRMIKLVNDYKNKGVTLVAISSNNPDAVCLEELGYTDLSDSFEDMKTRALDKAYNFVFLYDGDKQEVAQAYGPVATPHVFIFDRDRKLRYSGRIDDMENPYQKPTATDTRDAIDALLAGKPVPVEKTKVFGCSIKWLSKKAWRQQLNEQWAVKPVSVKMIDLTGIKALINNAGDTLSLINVYATWCGPCLIEFPELVNIQRMYGGRKFGIVSLSVDKPSQKDNVLNFLDKNQAAFRNYQYNSEDVYSLFPVVDPEWEGALPYSLLIAPGGKIVYRHMGLIDPLEVKKAVVGELGRYFADDK